MLRKNLLQSGDDGSYNNDSVVSEGINALSDSANQNVSGISSIKDGPTNEETLSSKNKDTASDLKVLQNSLATLTAEKTRMANAYQ